MCTYQNLGGNLGEPEPLEKVMCKYQGEAKQNQLKLEQRQRVIEPPMGVIELYP